MTGLYIIPPAGFTPDSVTQCLQTHVDPQSGQADFHGIRLDSAKEGDKLMAEIKAESEQKYPGEWKEENITASGSHPAKLYRYMFMGTVGRIIGYRLYFTDDFSRYMLEANYDIGYAKGNEMYLVMKTLVIKTHSN